MPNIDTSKAHLPIESGIKIFAISALGQVGWVPLDVSPVAYTGMPIGMPYI